jgi:hypothetical protein
MVNGTVEANGNYVMHVKGEKRVSSVAARDFRLPFLFRHILIS